MNRFDMLINEALVKDIKKIKLKRKIERAKRQVKKRIGKVRPPNTPGNIPVSSKSPALHKGINQDIADTPMTGVGS